MRIVTAILVLLLAAGTSLTAAQAQNTNSSRLRPFPVGSGNSAKTVNISVSYQFFIDGDMEDLDSQAKSADDGRKHLYRMLARECVVLLDTIADECHIKRANVSSRVRNYRSRQNGIQISGSATYTVELKPTRKKDTADNNGDNKN